jgi:hypothetical protein
VAPEKAEQLERLAGGHAVPFTRLGETGGPRMVFDTLFEITVGEARDLHESAIPHLLEPSAATATA